MDSIACEVGGKNYALNADGTVVDTSLTQVGVWTSVQGIPASNSLLLSLTSAPAVAVPARYSFNSHNQLLVALQKADGTWASQQAVNGRLVVHNNQDIGYQLVDDQGNDLAGAITVYGELRLDGNNDLTITLAGGGIAVIDADQISHDANNGTGTGDDVLVLTATTYDFDGGLMLAADISLPGSFKPVGNNLDFELNGNAGISLTFSGTFKGTSLGLEYHQGNGATTLVFTASGSYRWNSGNAAFTVYLGNSTNGFTATGTLSVGTTFNGGKGRLDGNLTFGGAGVGFSMQLTLDVQQKWDANNCIAFDVVASDSNGLISYDLGVEGTAKCAGGKLTFELKYSSTGAVTVDLGYSSTNLSAAIDFTFNQGMPTVGVTLSVIVSWQNGQRVASPVQAS